MSKKYKQKNTNIVFKDHITLYEWLLEKRIINMVTSLDNIHNILSSNEIFYYIQEIFNNNNCTLTEDIVIENDDRNFNSLDERILYNAILEYPYHNIPDNITKRQSRLLKGITINENKEIVLSIIPEDFFYVYKIIKENNKGVFINLKYHTHALNDNNLFLDKIYHGILNYVKEWGKQDAM